MKLGKHANIGVISIVALIFILFPLLGQQNLVISFGLLGIACLIPGLALIKLFKLEFDSKSIHIFFALNLSLLLLMGIFTVFSVITHVMGLSKPFSSMNIYLLMVTIIALSFGILRNEIVEGMDFFLHELTWRVFLPRFFLCLLPIISLYCVTRLNNQGDAKPTTIFLTLLLL